MYYSLSLLLLAGTSGDASRLAVIQDAPTFELVDAVTEKPAGTDQFRGKVLLVGFVFTTCTGSCPATTARMVRVQQEVAKHPELTGQVRLVSITLDPARDTPEVLRDYMKLNKADPGNWAFLTGPPARVRQTVADWSMWARPGANGQLDHPSRIFLVDRRGRVREIYNLDLLRVPHVVDDLRLLADER